MSYIGKTPTVGNFIKLDDISTSATNSYTLQHNSVNFSPESANHMLVSLNGVIQAPNTAFSVSGSTITFLPSSGTLSSSDSIDFIMVYGNVLDVGVASSVADASITKGKMNLISDSSSAGLTIKGDGGSENGTLQLNCSQNSHGVKISSPAHSSGQSYELILPTGNVTADKFLKVASVSGSGATGIGQLSFADAGGNTPSFLAYKTSNQSISNNTATKVTFESEQLDSDNTFTSSKFTPAVTGYYWIGARWRYDTGTDFDTAQYRIYKNGSILAKSTFINQNSNGGFLNMIVYSDSDDYFEMYAYQNSGGSVNINGDSTYPEQDQAQFFAFKLGGV